MNKNFENCSHSFMLTADLLPLTEYWQNLNLMTNGGPWVQAQERRYYHECKYCHLRKVIPSTPLVLDENRHERGYGGNRPIENYTEEDFSLPKYIRV